MKMSITKSGRLRKPSITLWCNWIIKAWDQIDPAAIIKSFKGGRTPEVKTPPLTPTLN